MCIRDRLPAAPSAELSASFAVSALFSVSVSSVVLPDGYKRQMLHRTPGDWDITTQAKPEQVKEIFAEKIIHTIDTGIQHGTVTVMVEHEGFEGTTYRIDGEYEDARHPKNVQFTASLLEDLKRRDFTINAMAYNDTTWSVFLSSFHNPLSVPTHK